MRPSPVFDAHLHIIDPRFPLVPSDGYLPGPFTVDDYGAATAGLAVAGGAVVSGSFQGDDQTYLLDALSRLGPGYVGVTRLPAEVSDEQVVALDAAGVRAVRVNLRREGSVGTDVLAELAHRVHDLVGWHVELYVDSRELAALLPALVELPQLVVDHLGLSRTGFGAVLALVDAGAYVKASGFGRVDLDVPEALRAIVDVNPGALLFGTDLPSTRAPRAFAVNDLDLLVDVVGEDLARAACWDNAVALYRPERVPRRPDRG